LPITPLDEYQIAEVENALSVNFNDRTVLVLALTHQSYVNEHPDIPPVSNERLEFLGDSIVGMVVADRMYSSAPELAEGDLTVRRSQVVRREWLVMGKGESAAGGDDRSSNLADTFEALVGAVFVDSDYESASKFVNRWLGEHVDEALRSETKKDPKSLLQEYLQANGSKPPRYRLVSESGVLSDLIFTMEVVIDTRSVALGEGSRKIDAEREAASRALVILKSSS
jgi:ribonuclease-3